jgi:CRISPR-associated protein Cmr1
MHQSITAEFSLNTPLFSSGVDKTKPELRVTEIKAALRFWWRAMNYGLVAGSNGSISKLAARESALFGSTKGQSPFLLRLTVNGIDTTLQPKSAADLVKHGASRYLGYGLTETKANRFGRDADSDTTFTIELTLRAEAVALGYQPEYVKALKLFGLFGGLGYRSRRGFGSVTLQKLSTNGIETSLPNATNLYGQLFQDEGLLSQCPTVPEISPPEYSAFVKNANFCRVVLVNQPHSPFTTGMSALDATADKFKTLLTSPVRGKARQQKGRAATTSDVSWAYMGLPREYAFGPLDHKPAAMDQASRLAELERRASPLMFHVHKAGAADYRAVAILFKSKFLPDGYGVSAGGGPADPLPTPPASGYEWIDDWLKGIGTEIKSTAGAA